MRLEKLNAKHRIDRFTCGNKPGAAEIDDYLKSSALIEQSARLATVWVAIDTDDEVVGFFAISPLSIRISDSVLEAMGLAKIPYPIGGYLLGRLGVDTKHQKQKYQGRTYGELLIAAAIKKAKEAAEEVGGAILAVDPKNDRLSEWYRNLEFGFSAVDSRNARLVMKL